MTNAEIINYHERLISEYKQKIEELYKKYRPGRKGCRAVMAQMAHYDQLLMVEKRDLADAKKEAADA